LYKAHIVYFKFLPYGFSNITGWDSALYLEMSSFQKFRSKFPHETPLTDGRYKQIDKCFLSLSPG
jgi:hypothetical protein